MMTKGKVTKKDIMSNYINVICVGYCNLQYLLKGTYATSYTCGVYGWNSDIYVIDYDTCIVTGYRPFGNIYPSCKGLCSKYEEKAKVIYHDYLHNNKFGYEVAMKKINKLLEKFVNECLKLKEV